MKPKNISILYIEENLVAREMFESIISTLCSKLYTAKNTKEALKLYKSKQIDIVIAALHIHESSSIPILTQIREMDPLQLFIYTVSHASEHLLFRAIELGADYYIAEPINEYSIEKTLIKAIHQVEYRESFVKLKESEEKFRQMSQTSQMGIFIYKKKYVYVNDAFSKMTGYSKKELYTMHPWDFVEEKHRELVKKICLRRLKGEYFPNLYHDLKIITKDAKIKINRVTTNTIQYEGAFAGFGTSTDVTDIINTKERLKLLAQAVEQMDEMVRITDVEGKIIYVNSALMKHTHYKKSELIYHSNNLFKSNQHDSSFYKKLWNTILQKRPFKDTFINVKKGGEIYYEDQTITPMVDEEGQIKYFVSTSQDVTSRIETEKKLKLLATTDALTGIYNRYKINTQIEEEFSRVKRYGGSFALIMFDIDFFKKVNDEYGHDVGDYVLQELCLIISSSLRESDKFGRWGGEEFMVLAPKLNEEEAINLAEKLRRKVQSHNFKDIGTLSISLGVVISDKSHTIDMMLKEVDDALYEAKNSGRNRVVSVKT